MTESIQQSLAEGALGFVLSSPHFTGDPHNGSIVPYPQWYLKEFPSSFGGVAPTLEIDYAIPAQPGDFPGDFDGDGDVDGDDLTDPVDGWKARYGVDLDGSDFLAWQRNITTGPAGLAGSAAGVPEPSSMILALISMATILTGRRSRRNRRVAKGGGFS